MGLKETVTRMRQLLLDINVDLEKAAQGNKAAAQRVRVSTLALEKVSKEYRKESVAAENTAMKKAKASRLRKKS